MPAGPGASQANYFASANRRRVGNLRIGKGFRNGEIGARETVVPGHCIFIPEGPEESQEKGAGGNYVARSAPEELLGGGCVAGEAGDLQTSDHHSRSGSSEDGKQAEILDIEEGEGREENNRAKFAEGEFPAEGAKESEEASVGEGQAGGVD